LCPERDLGRNFVKIILDAGLRNVEVVPDSILILKYVFSLDSLFERDFLVLRDEGSWLDEV
jgi:hypothetical protein